jgi:hypothetical protein
MPATGSPSSGTEKRRQVEALGRLAALLLGQERPQRMAAVQLVAAIRAHDEQALVAQAAQQRGQELERRAVGPLQVVDHEDHRPVGGELVEQAAKQAEQAGLGQRLAGCGQAVRAGRQRVGAQLGQQTRELGAVGAHEVVERLRPQLAHQAAQRAGDRRVRQLAGAEGHAVAAQHVRPRRGRQALQLAQQTRLADARLARYEHGCRIAGRRALEGAAERRQLVGAADELPARDAPCHMAIISGRRRRVGECAHAARRRSRSRLASAMRRVAPVERRRVERGAHSDWRRSLARACIAS